MKKVAMLVVLGATTLVPMVASADPAGDEGVVTTLPEIIVYGKRPPRPLVVVDIARPTAAHEAGAAHESLREALLKKSMPATLRR